MKPFIETQSGRRFWVTNPSFSIEDIAHGLSHVCRFSGQCERFYSVAEHSVMVSMIMEKWKLGDPMEGLLHDGTEAYLSDIPAPFKRLLPDYKAMEERVESSLRSCFGLPESKTEGCAYADQIALLAEAYHLLPSRGECFYDPDGLLEKAKHPALYPKCWTPDWAKGAFLSRFDQLVSPKVA